MKFPEIQKAEIVLSLPSAPCPSPVLCAINGNLCAAAASSHTLSLFQLLGIIFVRTSVITILVIIIIVIKTWWSLSSQLFSQSSQLTSSSTSSSCSRCPECTHCQYRPLFVICHRGAFRAIKGPKSNFNLTDNVDFNHHQVETQMVYPITQRHRQRWVANLIGKSNVFKVPYCYWSIKQN